MFSTKCEQHEQKEEARKQNLKYHRNKNFQ